MSKVTITFTLPDDGDNDPVAPAVMAIEESLPEDADNFEWDAE